MIAEMCRVRFFKRHSLRPGAESRNSFVRIRGADPSGSIVAGLKILGPEIPRVQLPHVQLPRDQLLRHRMPRHEVRRPIAPQLITMVAVVAVTAVLSLLPPLVPQAEVLWPSSPAYAVEELWYELCTSCHADDNPTCAGCHNHRGEMEARTAREFYLPGESVEVEFRGGNQPGWIRALLYGESGDEIDRRAGPTETGDDLRGRVDADSVAFPLVLHGVAPSEPGEYSWRAAYFGIFHVQDVTHDEEWTTVPLRVIDPSEWTDPTSWGRIKSVYRR